MQKLKKCTTTEKKESLICQFEVQWYFGLPGRQPLTMYIPCKAHEKKTTIKAFLILITTLLYMVNIN